MRVLLLTIVVLFLLPPICAAADIDGRDDKVPFGEGELAFRLGNTPADTYKLRYNTVSMGYTRGNGEYDQYLTANGATYPEPLHNVIKLRLGYLRFIRHMYSSENFEFNYGGGLSFSTYQHVATVAGKRAYFEEKTPGLHAQAGLGYHFNRKIAFEGNLQSYIFYNGNYSYILGPQIQLSFTPIDSINLYVGYRNWFQYLVFNEPRTEIQSIFTGSIVGLRLTF